MRQLLVFFNRVGVIFALPVILVLAVVAFAAAGQVLTAPQFESFMAHSDGMVEIRGKAAGFTHVELINRADTIGEGDITEAGLFNIRPVRPLQQGEYRFVLRSTDKNGHSATSVQTLVVSVPEQEKDKALALVEEPGKTRRLISGHRQLRRSDLSSRQDFAIETITYAQKKLTFCGKRPKGMRLSIISGNRTIGSEYADTDNHFCIVRTHAMETGDHIFRAELSDAAGKMSAVISLPFTIKNAAGMTRQVYRGGHPVKTIIVRRGETLSHIARRIYGSVAFSELLFDANRDHLRSRNEIHAGQELVLPPVHKEEQ